MSINSKGNTPNYKEIHQAFEAIRKKHLDKLGNRDVRYITRLRRLSRIFEVIGRTLIWLMPGPFAILGVPFLFLHRNIESIEIGHNVLHGQYDSFPEIPQFHTKNFRWKAPVDETSWRIEHNGIHHVYTNVEEKDPDLAHGFLRTNAGVPHTVWHYFQLPIYLFFVYPAMLYRFNGQNLGKGDQFREKRFPEGNKGYAIFHNPESLTERDIGKRHAKSVLRVLLKEYGIFPLLALLTGFGFVKVFLCNLLVDILNNYWIALTIQATHLTEPLQPDDAISNKGKWYVSQLDSSVNFKGNRWQSILWGHLNYQIEHHLFPDIPSHRYPEIAVDIQQVCKQFQLPYKENPSWRQAIFQYLTVLWHYSFKTVPSQFQPPPFLLKESVNA